MLSVFNFRAQKFLMMISLSALKKGVKASFKNVEVLVLMWDVQSFSNVKNIPLKKIKEH